METTAAITRRGTPLLRGRAVLCVVLLWITRVTWGRPEGLVTRKQEPSCESCMKPQFLLRCQESLRYCEPLEPSFPDQPSRGAWRDEPIVIVQNKHILIEFLDSFLLASVLSRSSAQHSAKYGRRLAAKRPSLPGKIEWAFCFCLRASLHPAPCPAIGS